MIPPRLSSMLHTAFAYLAAAGAGALGTMLHVPLAWMLGPMLVAAGLSISGYGIKPNDKLRRLGQLSIGGTVGLYLTSTVIVQLAGWLPVMVLSAAASILVSVAFGQVLCRYTKLDQTTAFFASLPGGLAEMSHVGSRLGARPEPIALVQTMRIGLVVAIMPPILVALGHPDRSIPRAEIISWDGMALVIAGGFCTSMMLRRLGLNNPFMLGSILFAGILAANGLLTGRFDPAVLAVAQILIGFTVGSRFKRAMLTEMPRVAAVGLVTIVGMISVLAGLGALLSLLGGLSLQGALLATSPGGFAEMAATAQVLHLSVPVVAGFQVVRSVMVNGFSTHFYALAVRIGLLDTLAKLLR